MLDARAPGLGLSSIPSRQCRLLRRQNKLTDANAACAKAIEVGSKVNGPLAWAEVLYLQGKYEEALVQVENGLSADGRNQRGYIVAALINQKLGRLDAATARFNGSFGLSKVLGVSLDDKRSPTEWLALLDRQQDRQDAAVLARCGHLYLDLDLPKQSQTCFAASQKQDPFLTAVARIEHQAETDPRAALRAGDALLSKSRDLELLLVMARVHARAGAPHEGISALREALYKLPPWELPEELIRTVCVELSLAECMKQSP
jgi:tetratricopeptide (TPR) repeat protein